MTSAIHRPLLLLLLALLATVALGGRPVSAEAVVLTAETFASTTQSGKATFVKVCVWRGGGGVQKTGREMRG